MKSEIFEAHITVASDSVQTEERFRSLCSDLEVKVIQIELPDQEFAPQLMTGSFHKGSFEHVRDEIYAMGKYFSESGFEVERHKIETMIVGARPNSYIPTTDGEALANVDNYFEFHIKVTEPDVNLDRICKEHDAHLSRSVSSRLKKKPQKFVTMRDYNHGFPTAQARFDELIDSLKGAGYQLSNKLREYCMLDDNRSVDNGWAEPTIAYCAPQCGYCPFMEKP